MPSSASHAKGGIVLPDSNAGSANQRAVPQAWRQLAVVAPAGFFGAHNLLSGLPREYSSRLRAKAHAVSLEKGKTLFETSAVGDGCYWLEEGVLKVSIASPQARSGSSPSSGRARLSANLRCSTDFRGSATVQALRDSRLTFLARSVFLEILHGHPEIYRHLLTVLVERLRQADDEVAAASFLSLKARVARALLQFAKHLGEPTATPGQLLARHRIRQDDLAALANVARENASRILSDWTARKVIAHPSPTVYLIDKAKLEREAGISS
jgi:CRP/FNR family transcriptional regulator